IVIGYMKVIVEISVPPDFKQEQLDSQLSLFCGCSVTSYSILRKALDARKIVVYRYRCCVDIPQHVASALISSGKAMPYQEKEPIIIPKIKTNKRIPIVGCGPAGLFCALTLIEAGIAVDIYERGKILAQRHRDVTILRERGILDSNSNVVFGEGGAGTYSDGKLTTRINKKEIELFYNFMVQFGAPSSIKYEAKPHIGTDRLIGIIENIRNYIMQKNSTIQYGKKLTDILIDNNTLQGCCFNNNEEIVTDILVLATGHSARDVYQLLHIKGIALQNKGFAVGVRIEHPRELIDEIQYGRDKDNYGIYGAEYKLTYKDITGRGVYSFCMCPGGFIINSSSEEKRLCVNGMSYSKRNGAHSNAALVVTVSQNDFEDIWDGINFQILLEEKAYQAGGDSFIAPAQRITSFLQNSLDSSLPVCTYKPKVVASNLNAILPDTIREPLKRAIVHFGSQMKGFVTQECILVGVETRTSSPVRIVRDESFQSINCKGLYPAGEGAGYAGGIVSSAVDGIRAAQKILTLLERM
ncbi:MAG: NAD(P)/FAD-dependent oxidoreductase, partial [Spirochaetota bacterium]